MERLVPGPALCGLLGPIYPKPGNAFATACTIYFARQSGRREWPGNAGDRVGAALASVICFIDPTYAHYAVLLCTIRRSIASRSCKGSLAENLQIAQRNSSIYTKQRAAYFFPDSLHAFGGLLTKAGTL